MKRHIFISPRPAPIPRWLEAFPQSEFIQYLDSGTVFAHSFNDAVIWLHYQADAEELSNVIVNIRKMAPGSPVVFLSNHPNNDEGLNVFSAGAVGYCNALAFPDLLCQVANVVEQGGLWIGRDLMQRLFSALTSHGASNSDHTLSDLSPRERQVAHAVARGSTNKEIARAMGITERTVKAHLSNVFEKLGVRDRLQLSLFVNGVETPAPESRKILA